ncbi:MAG: acetate/propionate family kinase [Candidatus Hodarchaeales archaeon]|jgi:acetate kinase
MIILTLNCGSSSVKYSLFDTKTQNMLAKGIVGRIGLSNSYIHHNTQTMNFKRDIKCKDHTKAIKYALDMIISPLESGGVLKNLKNVEAVGHRVVHGGEKFIRSTLVNNEVEQVIEDLSELAPLHNPPNLQGIRAAKAHLPNVSHVAIFDTAFHQTMPDFAYRYAIPQEWYSEYKVRRYGFHGTSHYYVSQRAKELLNKSVKNAKIITLHLGNGASVTAVKEGVSIDTSMGMTPLEGLIMGTRSGDIDPAVIFYMLRSKKMSPKEIDNTLNRESGLLGITNYQDVKDVVDLAKKGDTNAMLALKMATYRIRKYIGAYFMAMEGLDAIVFTAGIGENSSYFRELVLEGLDFFGVELDKKTNLEAIGGSEERIISKKTSKIKVFVIPTNEELVMAQDVEKIVSD